MKWKSDGFPLLGDSFDLYSKAKQCYKKLIYCKRKESNQCISKNLEHAFINNSKNKFWKLWNANFKSKDPSFNYRFDGFDNKKDIADHLASCHAAACTPNNLDVNEKLKSNYEKATLLYNKTNYFSSANVTVEDVDQAISEIENNTAAGHDSIYIEHFKFAHPSLISILSVIFNIFLILGKVPTDFGIGIVTPIPKFKGHRVTVTADDFRSITVNPIASKIFEHCILKRFLSSLSTSSRQFGFKKGISCLDAVNTVKRTVTYSIKMVTLLI